MFLIPNSKGNKSQIWTESYTCMFDRLYHGFPSVWFRDKMCKAGIMFVDPLKHVIECDLKMQL